jgi:hypothetical protein
MVNTRSEANRGPRDDQNAREEGNLNNPQLTRLNEKIEQMAKSIEDLANMNAILQARVPELHRVVKDPENWEARDSHIGKRREDKGKASLVENLLQKTTSPFTEDVANIRLPVEHLDNFRAHMDLHQTPEMVACRAFPLTLSGNARDWFRKIMPNFIRHFDDLGRMFLTQFMAGRVRRKPSGSLMSLHQRPEESLKDFFMRFNQARLEPEIATDDFIYGALFQGIWKDGALVADIARKPH